MSLAVTERRLTFNTTASTLQRRNIIIKKKKLLFTPITSRLFNVSPVNTVKILFSIFHHIFWNCMLSFLFLVVIDGGWARTSFLKAISQWMSLLYLIGKAMRWETDTSTSACVNQCRISLSSVLTRSFSKGKHDTFIYLLR